jgi:hypothetical protein
MRALVLVGLMTVACTRPNAAFDRSCSGATSLARPRVLTYAIARREAACDLAGFPSTGTCRYRP